jgi:hypothetical protein
MHWQAGKEDVPFVPKDNIRALGVEQLAKTMEFCCKFSESGCKEILEFVKKDVHELTCGFKPVTCPCTGCDHICRVHDLGAHIQMRHVVRVCKFGEPVISP